jgi:polyhydroxybutyrate depolymerase
MTISSHFKTCGIGVAALFAGALVSFQPSTADATCANNTLTPGDTTTTIQFGGLSRTFLLHVPASFNGSTAVPLVIDMHGFTSTASAQRSVSGFRAVSDQQGFIIAWPQGANNSWNAFGCCGTALSRNRDDVGFIRAVVANIIQRGKIDQSRIYATGLSNGGSMSHKLACQAADLFAATAPVSFTLNVTATTCRPSRPISVTHFHGLNDTTVRFNGGTFQSAPTSATTWRQIDACTAIRTQTFTSTDRCEFGTGCSAGVSPALCRLSGSHVLYNTQSTMNIAQFAWANGMAPFSNPTKPVGCP